MVEKTKEHFSESRRDNVIARIEKDAAAEKKKEHSDGRTLGCLVPVGQGRSRSCRPEKTIDGGKSKRRHRYQV